VRWVAVFLVAAAVVTLVVARLGGGDEAATAGAGSGQVDAPGSGPTTSTTELPSTTVAADATGEPALADPPSKLTRAELGGIRFTDVTKAAGLDHIQSELPLGAEHAMTSGAAVADVDGDGRPDVYLTRVDRPNSLYRNRGDGTFEDVTATAGLEGPGPITGQRRGSGGAAFGDVNADGCPDLYVGGAADGEAGLFVNDCHGHFTDETVARGVALPPTIADLGTQGHGVTFADWDHDGDLDLLVLHWDPAFLGGLAGQAATGATPDPTSTCEKAADIRRRGGDRVSVAGPNRSRLFANDGTGHFHDVTAAVGLQLDRIAAFGGEFVDVDGDGWEDLAIAGDFCTTALYHNDAGRRFVDVTARSGIGTAENAMGSVLRDVDGDGRPDWFLSSIALRTASGRCLTRLSNTGCSGNRLYLNRPDGRFVDATDDYGVRSGGWGWGAAIEDFGNDGRLEIAQTNGYEQSGAAYAGFATDRTRFWVPTGEGDHHEDGAELAGIDDTGIGHALVAFDYDGDGDLDLLVAHFGTAPTLYRNDTPRRGRHWLSVQLDDPLHPGNRQGLGSRVVVTSGPAGSERRSTGWISTGGSYESQKPPLFHVGFGRDRAPVRVEVWWPGATVPQLLDHVDVDQVLTVTRAGA
jgi:hypothetical protein